MKIIDWTPCDEEPVLFLPGGNLTLVKKRNYIEGCALYKPGAGKRPDTALIPHYYTCPVLREQRREWAIANARRRQ